MQPFAAVVSQPIRHKPVPYLYCKVLREMAYGMVAVLYYSCTIAIYMVMAHSPIPKVALSEMETSFFLLEVDEIALMCATWSWVITPIGLGALLVESFQI